MIRRPSMRCPVAVMIACCYLASGQPASGEIKIQYSVPQLFEISDVVLLVRPAETPQRGKLISDRFIVDEVLRGSPDLKGKRINVNLRDYNCRGKKHVRTVLLFVRHSQRGHHFEPVHSGVRFLLTDDGEVLVPNQWINPGPFGFHVDKQTDWIVLLSDLRRILPIMNRMHAFLHNFNRSSDWVELRAAGQTRSLLIRSVLSSTIVEPKKLNRRGGPSFPHNRDIAPAPFPKSSGERNTER